MSIYIYPLSCIFHSINSTSSYIYIYINLYMRISYIVYPPCNTSTNSRSLESYILAYLLHCPYKTGAIWSLPEVRTKGRLRLVFSTASVHWYLRIREDHLSMVIHRVSYMTFPRSSWQAPFFTKTLMTSEWFP